MIENTLKGQEAQRKKNILREASRDLEVGFLLSVFELEWTIRRLILFFAKCPTVVIRAYLAGCSGLKAYADAWKLLVVGVNPALPELHALLGLDASIGSNSSSLEKCLDRRHLLVHGASSGINRIDALIGLDLSFSAIHKLADFAEKHGVDIYKRLRDRKMVKCGYSGNSKTFEHNKVPKQCPSGLYTMCPLTSFHKIIYKNIRCRPGEFPEVKGVSREELSVIVSKKAAGLGLGKSNSVRSLMEHISGKR